MAAPHEQWVDRDGWLRDNADSLNLWNRQRHEDSLNLWHGIMESEARGEYRKPGLSRKAWLGIAFGLYLSFMLGLAGWVLWKVAHPLPHLIP